MPLALPTGLEAFAVVATLLCVWLGVLRRILNWPVGLVAVSAYFALFVRERLYADAGLQVVFFAQGLYGWWSWTRAERGAEIPVRTLGTRGRLLVLLAIAAGAGTLGFLLDRHTDAAAPWVDAPVSVTSLVANQLLARRYIENWLLWAAADVTYVLLFWWKGLHASALLYAVFLAMVASGWVRWSRERALAPPLAQGT